MENRELYIDADNVISGSKNFLVDIEKNKQSNMRFKMYWVWKNPLMVYQSTFQTM